MSNLLNSPAGLTALREATAQVIRKRISRWFVRNTVIGFDNWVLAGKPNFLYTDALQVLGSLNVYHDKEILDLLDCLRRIEITSESIDLAVYIDTVNGDDIDGDGSPTNPFQSGSRAQELLPEKINSLINIYVNSTAAVPAVFDCATYRLGPQGQIVIQGQNDPTVHDAGPYAITVKTAISALHSYGFWLDVAGAPWLADAHRGRFIEMLTGAQAGRVYSITTNTTGSIMINNCGIGTPAVADTFRIVSPSNYITTTAPSGILEFTMEDQSQDYVSSSFGLVNLSFPVGTYLSVKSSSSISYNLLFIRCFDVFYQAGSYHIANWITLYDDNVIPAKYRFTSFTANPQTSFVGLYTFGAQVVNEGFLVMDNGWSALSTESPTLRLNHCHTGLILFTVGGSQFGYLHNCLGNCSSDWLRTRGQKIELDNAWAERCSDVIQDSNSHIIVRDLEGVPANISGYTIRSGPGTSMDFEGTPVSPPAGENWWNLNGAAVAFPVVAGNAVTDGKGSWTAKLS